MPPLLKSASLKTDVSIKDLDEEGDDDEERDEDEWETIELGDKRISIRTSVLEEKATACYMLYCYAEELKEGFYPYVEIIDWIARRVAHVVGVGGVTLSARRSRCRCGGCYVVDASLTLSVWGVLRCRRVAHVVSAGGVALSVWGVLPTAECDEADGAAAAVLRSRGGAEGGSYSHPGAAQRRQAGRAQGGRTGDPPTPTRNNNNMKYTNSHPGAAQQRQAGRAQGGRTGDPPGTVFHKV
eukprot:1195140-Prorocentrum_minimum.AAC.3